MHVESGGWKRNLDLIVNNCGARDAATRGSRGRPPTPSRSLSSRDRCALRDYCTRQNFYLSNGGKAGRSMDVKNHQTFSNFFFFSLYTSGNIDVRAPCVLERVHAYLHDELRDRNNKSTHGRCLKTTRVLVYRHLNSFFAHVPSHVRPNRAPWRNPISDLNGRTKVLRNLYGFCRSDGFAGSCRRFYTVIVSGRGRTNPGTRKLCWPR